MIYAVIGTGNMASAILKGIYSSGKFSADTLYAFDKDEERLKTVSAYGVIPVKSAQEAAGNAEIVLLCVKPQNLNELLPEIFAELKNKLVITIAAGKDIAFYEKLLPETAALVRVMPNINAKVGAAVSALCKNKNTTEEQFDAAKKVMGTIGGVIELSEEFFPLFGAIAGSSVAFVYMYIDALIKVQTSHGLDEASARVIAAQAVKGSAELVLGTDEECLSLTKQVCSPGGTTIEGVTKLNEYGFEEKVKEAIEAILLKDELIRKG